MSPPGRIVVLVLVAAAAPPISGGAEDPDDTAVVGIVDGTSSATCTGTLIDDEDGHRMADSNLIIQHLRRQYGDKLDEGVTPREEAQMVAFNRLVDDHLYWIAVIQPRYVDDGDWHRYLCMIANVTEVPPEVQAFGDAWRARVLNEDKGDFVVPVKVTDENGDEPFKAQMTWAWVPKKKPT